MILLLSLIASNAIAREVAPATVSQIGVGAQYDTTHDYVAPEDIEKFIASFLATFGGQSTKQVVVTVTPTSSSTTSQLLQTPVGTVSVFGFKTPIPYPFGAERTGYLVTDLDKAITLAKASGADIVVAAFPDPIGRNAVVQWPGGVNMQLYWHSAKPSYAALKTIPENRVYISPGRADAFTRDFLRFSHGKVVSDEPHTPGIEVGRPNESIRRIRIESIFGKMTVFVTRGHLHSLMGASSPATRWPILRTRWSRRARPEQPYSSSRSPPKAGPRRSSSFRADTSPRFTRRRVNAVGRQCRNGLSSFWGAECPASVRRGPRAMRYTWSDSTLVRNLLRYAQGSRQYALDCTMDLAPGGGSNLPRRAGKPGRRHRFRERSSRA